MAVETNPQFAQSVGFHRPNQGLQPNQQRWSNQDASPHRKPTESSRHGEVFSWSQITLWFCGFNLFVLMTWRFVRDRIKVPIGRLWCWPTCCAGRQASLYVHISGGSDWYRSQASHGECALWTGATCSGRQLLMCRKLSYLYSHKTSCSPYIPVKCTAESNWIDIVTRFGLLT